MKLLAPFALLALLAAGPLAAQTVGDETPDDLVDALTKGFGVVTVVGQGSGNHDHVVYLAKNGRTILCGYRVVVGESGVDAKQSGPLGACFGFIGQN